ncbi:hypothetical protein [Mycoplasmopsis adleri]|uniref:hypothetical protein n=1 Tax=Mycoplasmopsis adleri TaxID=51362 RepID=UPI003873411D
MNLLNIKQNTVQNSCATQLEKNPLKYLSIVFGPESDFPKVDDPKQKYKAIVSRVFRDIYSVIVGIIILFSFVNFYLQREFNNIHNLTVKNIELFTFFFLIFDLVIHWVTYPARDYTHVKIWKSVLTYPLTPGFWVLIISILPSLYVINIYTGHDYKVLEAFKAFKFLRILRLIMLLNMFPVFSRMAKALKNDKVILINVIIFVCLLLVLFSLTIWYTETQWVIEQARAMYIT